MSRDNQLIVAIDFTDEVRAISKTGSLNSSVNVFNTVSSHLDYSTQFFVKECGNDVARCGALDHAVHVKRNTRVTGKHHFSHRGQQTAVRAIVVRHDGILGRQFANHLHKGGDVSGAIHIGRDLTELLRHETQNGTGHTVLGATQVDSDQNRGLIGHQLRRQGQTNVLHRGGSRDNQRNRAHHRLLFASVFPRSLHGQGVLTDRDGNTQFLANGARSFHGIVELGVFTFVTASSHPVGAQLHEVKINVGACDIRNRFADRHTRRGSSVRDGQRGAFTHTHGFTVVTDKADVGHSSVSHRHLPRAHHLVTMDQTAHRAVTDRDQEALAGHRRVTQNVRHDLLKINAFGLKFRQRHIGVLNIAVHTRGLTQQDFHRHFDGRRLFFATSHHQRVVFADRTQNSVRATFTLTHGIKRFQAFRSDGDGITFLTFVTPDFERAHTGLFNRHLSQIELGTVTGQVSQFRHGVRQTTGTHVMDSQNRIVFTGCPATVDHFLCATFHFGVAALDAIEVKSFGVRTRGHGACSTTAQTDSHTRATQAN